MQRARLPQTRAKGEYEMENTIKVLQHKESKLSACRQSFKEHEALVYHQLTNLIRDTVWLKSYLSGAGGGGRAARHAGHPGRHRGGLTCPPPSLPPQSFPAAVLRVQTEAFQAANVALGTMKAAALPAPSGDMAVPAGASIPSTPEGLTARDTPPHLQQVGGRRWFGRGEGRAPALACCHEDPCSM